jgi:transmembrane sensor
LAVLKKDRLNINPAILAEAAEWFAVLGSGQVSKAETEQWQAWLASHPDHRTAWSRVEYFMHKFHNLPSHAASAALNSPDLYRRRVLKAIAVFGAISLTGWEIWREGYLQQMTSDYHTQVGTTQIIALSDGSQILLDTNSSFNVEYTRELRRVHLISGAIYIETAPDGLHRPFVADCKEGRVRALGTRFSLKQEQGNSQVTVFEGAVEIQPANRGSAKKILQSGQETNFTREEVYAPLAIDSDRPAWTQGIILADNMPLSEFLLQLNRYRLGYVTCAPEIANMRIVGSFPLSDTDHVLATLEKTLPVKISKPMPLWVKVLPR